ncbi:uncharacterized protein LOC132617402 [Lycium barbarum]|uniref:uncharacterized protein LOC132617402 n=1 Tax=Lycium barbarum TaxID=112863 RepID=UPI00293EB700|nr:uncharacterized protein LOC132617402 [Lycium barbarum]XP_060188377.1 uncharacterized protein LOC132617402 [Lycium barbarum]
MTMYLRVTKTVKLNVKESDRIENVKALLHDKEGIRVCHQQLVSEDNRLMDERKLVDYGICENSTLHTYVEDSVIPVILLYVKRSYAEGAFTVYSRIYDTVKDVKSRIAAKEGTNSEEFSLIHDEDSLLQVVPGTMQIFIRKCNSESIMLDVHRHDLIKDVKGMLLNKLAIPLHLQNLVFARKCLADSRDLASYNIHKESILYLVLHMTPNVDNAR